MENRITCDLPALVISLSGHAQGTRLLREPAISDQEIVFNYAGDLWTVKREGGEARRLTSFLGEEMNASFSPDGRMIAFTGMYAGNSEIYVVNADGGEPKRLTWHPGYDHVCGWTADGKKMVDVEVVRKGTETHNLTFTLI